MPKLGNTQVERVTLPSSTPEDEAWVELNLSLTAGEVLSIRERGDDSAELSVAMLAKSIVNWNFTQDNGELEPVNEDNVKRLPAKDFNYLSEKLLAAVAAKAANPLSTDEKKVS